MPYVPQYETIAFVLQFISFLPLVALLFTVFLSKSVNRHPVFINFLCTRVIYSALQNFMWVASPTSQPHLSPDIYLLQFRRYAGARSAERLVWGNPAGCNGHDVRAWRSSCVVLSLKKPISTQISALNLVIHVRSLERIQFGSVLSSHYSYGSQWRLRSTLNQLARRSCAHWWWE